MLGKEGHKERERRRETERERERRKGSEKSAEERPHLFDKPSPHPSQNPSEKVMQDRKRGNTMSVCKYIDNNSTRSSERLYLNGYDVFNSSLL